MTAIRKGADWLLESTAPQDVFTRERLSDEHRMIAQTATEFFVRYDLARVREALLDLEQLTQEASTPADFVDLGEVSEFNPLVMDGECSA